MSVFAGKRTFDDEKYLLGTWKIQNALYQPILPIKKGYSKGFFELIIALRIRKIKKKKFRKICLP